jgi:hypothetical protein
MSSVADEGSGAAFGRLRIDRQTPFFLTRRQESAGANRQVGTTCKGSCVHVLAWYTKGPCINRLTYGQKERGHLWKKERMT